MSDTRINPDILETVVKNVANRLPFLDPIYVLNTKFGILYCGKPMWKVQGLAATEEKGVLPIAVNSILCETRFAMPEIERPEGSETINTLDTKEKYLRAVPAIANKLKPYGLSVLPTKKCVRISARLFLSDSVDLDQIYSFIFNYSAIVTGSVKYLSQFPSRLAA